jgi:hypothetical protein
MTIRIVSAETCHITNETINKQKVTAYIQTTMIVEDDTDDGANVSVVMRMSYTGSNKLYRV